MRLRDVTLADEDLYVRLRCDPDMMSELGGALDPAHVPDKVRRDVDTVERDEGWICVVEDDDGEPLGHVCLWHHDEDGEEISEIGWMVLPEHQGRGVGKGAVASLLDRAAADGRWGAIHAYPGVTNGPSNGICRSLGFTLVETVDVSLWDDGSTLPTNHWRWDPPTGETA